MSLILRQKNLKKVISMASNDLDIVISDVELTTNLSRPTVCTWRNDFFNECEIRNKL